MTGPLPPPPAVASSGRAAGALVVAAFLFGSTFLVVQDAIEHAAVLPFLAVRFLIGAALLWPIARRRPGTPRERRHGLVGGACLVAGYVLQTVGLRSTSTSSSAFITYLLVVFVPLVSALLARRWPRPEVVGGVALAVAGLFLLSGGVHGIGRGEVLTLGCSFAFGLHLVVVGRTALHHDAIRLTCWQLLTVGVACAVPGWFSGGYGFGLSVWLAAAFCGVGATAIAFLCLVWGQQAVPEARAAIILLLEPVFAAVLGYLSGERLGVGGVTGATFILAAVLLTELAPRRRAAGRPAA